MFVDIYNLGQGEVCATNEAGAVFSIRNLQVVRGYRFEAIPVQVLDAACGPLGKWKATTGVMPTLEIVYHNQSPLAWTQLPSEFRTRDFQKAGSARKLVPITNPAELAMFAAGKRPYKVAAVEFKSKKPPKNWEVPDMKQAAIDGVEGIKRGVEMKDAPKAPPPLIELPNTMPDTGAPDITDRPDIKQMLTGGVPGSLDIINPDALNFGEPGPGDEVGGGILEDEDAIQPTHEAPVTIDVKTCQASTARGDRCRRRARPGSSFCGAHPGG